MASHVYKFKSPAKQIIFSDDWLYCRLCPVPKIPATEQSCGWLKNEKEKLSLENESVETEKNFA